MFNHPQISRRRRGHSSTERARSFFCVAAAVGLWLGGVCVVGCRSGGGGYLNENDQLRSENLRLTRAVAKLEEDLAHRLAQIQGLEQRLGHTVKVDGVTSSDIPRLVSVAFGRLSGAVDTNHDHVVDTLRLYVKTLDQHGRFIPVAGVARVQVARLRPGQAPTRVLDRTWEPKVFHASYRSSLAGTHYTLELPLEPSELEAADPVTVKLSLTDAATGVETSCQKPVALVPERRADPPPL